jgi:hypothetical protein
LHLEDDVYLLLAPSSPPSNPPSSLPPPPSSRPSRDDVSVYVTSSSTLIPLPPPPLLHYEKGSFSDFIILGGIGVLIAVGIVLALLKVGCLHRHSLSLPLSHHRQMNGHIADHERVQLMSAEGEEGREGEIDDEEIDDLRREEEQDSEMALGGEMELPSKKFRSGSTGGASQGGGGIQQINDHSDQVV